jgi:hypothetical protein
MQTINMAETKHLRREAMKFSTNMNAPHQD